MPRPFTSLYLHVPFCEAKCDYCAFYSVDDASPELRKAYAAGIDRDLRAALPLCGPMESVYVGGGTPSALPAAELDALLGLVRARLPLADGAECTVECNPNSLTTEKIDILALRGVNRVSLGVQSFDPRLRSVLGRRGSIEGLPDALASLREAGIRNVGLDLIYAIPGESAEDWDRDLEQALALTPGHVSTYELTVEPQTPLGRRAPPAAPEELAVEMWQTAGRVLGRAGIRRYEVSNLARPGSECRHNMDVWHGATYLGCGPAAAGFDGEVRRANPRSLSRWLAGAPPEEDRLPALKRAGELLGLGLRTVRGWGRDEFASRTGMDYAAIRADALQELAEQGFLEMDPASVRPTERGLLFADYVADRLL
jgi:oxygen-independent coproporphyrinogen-3 oxidase